MDCAIVSNLFRREHCKANNHATQLVGVTTLLHASMQIVQVLSNYSARRVWSYQQQVPYVIFGNQWISYDDVQSLAIKV